MRIFGLFRFAMGSSRAVPVVKGGLSLPWLNRQFLVPVSSFRIRKWSTATAIRACLQAPDVPRLAQTARISLTPTQVHEFAPKIRQVVHWFGQLQTVDLQSIEPSIRADTEGGNQRNDVSETFENREGMIGAVPVFDEPYIRVPKVLNKE